MASTDSDKSGQLANLPDPSDTSTFHIPRGPVVDDDASTGAEGFVPTASVSEHSADTTAGEVASPTSTDTFDANDPEAMLAYQSLERHKREKRRKRIITSAIVGAILLGLGFFGVNRLLASRQDDNQPTIATTTVWRGDLIDSVSSNGATRPLDSVVVTPEVDGIIENLSVQEGQTVKAGDILFTIKNNELDKNVRTAELAVRSAQNAVNSAQEDLNAARGGAAQTAGLTGNEGLGDGGEEETVTPAQETSATTVEAARIALENAQVELESAQEALTQAQEQAAKREVKAPKSGTIIAMNAVEGAAVGSGASSEAGSLITIADLSQMRVTVQVNEVDIMKIKKDQEATITFSALPDVELKGTVTRIAATSGGNGEDSYDGGGIVSYPVDILIPEPDENLKPGMTASVEIVSQHVEDVLIVPVTAVTEEAEGTGYVTVIEDLENPDESSKTVYVKILAQSASDVAVEPINEGELDEGMEVELGGYSMGGEDGSDDYGYVEYEMG